MNCYRAFYLRNTINLSDAEKQNADTMIWNHILAAAEMIKNQVEGQNLYVSGSLARGEPSFSNEGPRGFSLASDIDFVLVGNRRPADLGSIEENLNTNFVDFRDTLYWLPAGMIQNLYSASALDLITGMKRPVFLEFDLPLPKTFSITLAEMLEVVVYQVAGSLGSSTAKVQSNEGYRFWDQSPNYQLMKTVSDTMRALSVHLGGRPTLQSAWLLKDRNDFQSVFGAKGVERLVQARENWSDQEIYTRDDISNFVRRFLALVLSVEENDLDGIISELKARVYYHPIPLHIFPLRVFEALFKLSHGSMNSSRVNAVDSWLQSNFHAERSEYIEHMIRAKDAGGAIWNWRSIERNQV